MQDVFQCALSLGRKEEGRQGGNGRRGTNKNKVQALGAEGQDKGESYSSLATGYSTHQTASTILTHHHHTTLVELTSKLPHTTLHETKAACGSRRGRKCGEWGQPSGELETSTSSPAEEAGAHG
jgi:hypothetical protein